jgi:hypothetical protein
MIKIAIETLMPVKLVADYQAHHELEATWKTPQ